MKKDIHPEYHKAKVHCACGNEFETGSTVEELVGGSDPFDPTSTPSETLDAEALLEALEDEGISPETLYEFALYWMTTPP